MSNKVATYSLITEVKFDPETSAFQKLESARVDFKNLVNRYLSHRGIDTSTDLKILSFMHWFEKEGHADLSYDQQMEVWNAFEEYRGAKESYHQLFSGETIDSTLQSLREIDPSLVGQSRYQKDDSYITQAIKNIYYSISGWLAGDAVIQKYRARMTVLEPLAQRDQETQKVLTIFSKFFSNPATNLEDVSDVLERCHQRKEWAAQRDHFEGYLSLHVHHNVDYILQRDLTQPLPFLECEDSFEAEVVEKAPLVDEVVEESSNEKAESSEGSKEERGVFKGDEAGMILRAFLRIEIGDEKTLDPLETLLPLDQIDSIQLVQTKDGDVQWDVTFKSEFSEAKTHMQVLKGQTIRIAHCPEEKKTSFPNGGSPLAQAILRQHLQNGVGTGKPLAQLEKLLPIAQVDSVQLIKPQEGHLQVEMTFKTKMQGGTHQVAKGGWQDMEHSQMFMGQKFQILALPNNGEIIFQEGALQLAIHMKDLSFIKSKLGFAECGLLNTFLWNHGFLSSFGHFKPMDIDMTVQSIKIFEGEGVGLRVAVHDKKDLPFPREGTYPEGACLEGLKGELKSYSLEKEEFDQTFAGFSWQPVAE